MINFSPVCFYMILTILDLIKGTLKKLYLCCFFVYVFESLLKSHMTIIGRENTVFVLETSCFLLGAELEKKN